VRGHLSSIWPVPDTAPDRSAYVGEAAGIWLWLIGLPADAGYAVLENLAISDLRHRHVRIAPPAARSSWLRPGRHPEPTADSAATSDEAGQERSSGGQRSPDAPDSTGEDGEQ